MRWLLHMKEIIYMCVTSSFLLGGCWLWPQRLWLLLTRLRGAKLKLESNNESSALCLEPVEQTRGVSTAQCEFQSVGGVIVSNYLFIVHVASQQESAAHPQSPRSRSYHAGVCVCVCREWAEPNQITVWALCANLLMRKMLSLNGN